MHRSVQHRRRHTASTSSRDPVDGRRRRRASCAARPTCTPRRSSGMRSTRRSRAGAGTLVVDLTGVTFVDSMMLGVLLATTRRSAPARDRDADRRRRPACAPHLRADAARPCPRSSTRRSSSRSRGDADPQAVEVTCLGHRIEHRHEPVERRDLEHPSGRLGRRDERELAAALANDALRADERLQRRRVDERALGENDDDRFAVERRRRARRRSARPSRGRARRRRGSRRPRLACRSSTSGPAGIAGVVDGRRARTLPGRASSTAARRDDHGLMTETILLTVPAGPRGAGVVALVLGGLGSRLDFRSTGSTSSRWRPKRLARRWSATASSSS